MGTMWFSFAMNGLGNILKELLKWSLKNLSNSPYKNIRVVSFPSALASIGQIRIMSISWSKLWRLKEYFKCIEIEKATKFYFNSWIKIRTPLSDKKYTASWLIMGSQADSIISVGVYKLVLGVGLWEFNLRALLMQIHNIGPTITLEVRNQKRNDYLIIKISYDLLSYLRYL